MVARTGFENGDEFRDYAQAYPGWCGQLYDEHQYLTRSKFSEAKFKRKCLAEYAQTFSTVCVDAGYHHFPSEKWIGGLCAQVPDHFRFGFKVTDEISGPLGIRTLWKAQQSADRNAVMHLFGPCLSGWLTK